MDVYKKSPVELCQNAYPTDRTSIHKGSALTGIKSGQNAVMVKKTVPRHDRRCDLTRKLKKMYIYCTVDKRHSGARHVGNPVGAI